MHPFSYNMMPQMMNPNMMPYYNMPIQAPIQPQPMLNPHFLNQYLLAQQMQMLMMNTKSGETSQASSTRTILLDEPKKVKMEEPPKEVEKQLDFDVISQELRTLIQYLATTEVPSQKFIDENIKTLPKVNSQLVSIIVDRHQSQKKTKEEQIKFVLRKCFKFLKNKLDINEVIVTPLEMEKRLYKEYFDGEEAMIPFRENSNMKTMNAQYLKKIFQSSRFVEAFREYLENFDKIWDEENEEKVDNMIKQVIKLIQQNRVNKLTTYRRIPWVPSIKEKCRTLAQNMLKYAAPPQQNDRKHVKTDEE